MTKTVLTISAITMIIFFIAGAAILWIGNQGNDILTGVHIEGMGIMIMLAGLTIGLLGTILTLRQSAK
jgi:hypothetical protein